MSTPFDDYIHQLEEDAKPDIIELGYAVGCKLHYEVAYGSRWPATGQHIERLDFGPMMVIETMPDGWVLFRCVAKKYIDPVTNRQRYTMPSLLLLKVAGFEETEEYINGTIEAAFLGLFGSNLQANIPTMKNIIQAWTPQSQG